MGDLHSDSDSEGSALGSLAAMSSIAGELEMMSEEEAIQMFGASKIQGCVRTFLVRTRLLKKLRARYEKIMDPNRKKYYYYDKKSDKSSWKKPHLFRNNDVEEISSLFTEEEAAIKLQTRIRMMLSLLRVRLMYQGVVERYLDEESGGEFFHNPRTDSAMWELPSFMAGRLDYAKKVRKPAASKIGSRRTTAAKAKRPNDAAAAAAAGGGGSDADGGAAEAAAAADFEGEAADSGAEQAHADDGEDDGDAESEESGLSDDSEAIREKRRKNRKFPR